MQWICVDHTPHERMLYAHVVPSNFVAAAALLELHRECTDSAATGIGRRGRKRAVPDVRVALVVGSSSDCTVAPNPERVRLQRTDLAVVDRDLAAQVGDPIWIGDVVQPVHSDDNVVRIDLFPQSPATQAATRAHEGTPHVCRERGPSGPPRKARPPGRPLIV
eukprot:5988186-Prymnesium_polylepis.2